MGKATRRNTRVTTNMSKGNDSDVEDDTNDLIRRQGNKIYFFAEVSAENILVLFKELEEVRQYCSTHGLNRIYLHIQSEGGCLFSGLNAMEHISNLDIEVCGVVSGCVASAATLMLLGCDYIQMYEYSFLLIHQLSTSIDFGRFNELKDEINNSEKMNESLKKIYLRYTDLTKAKVDELFTKEMYMDSTECLQYGIIDEII